MIKKLSYTANGGHWQWSKLLLGVICWLGGHGVIADVFYPPHWPIEPPIVGDPYQGPAPEGLHIKAINSADVLTFVPSSSPHIRIFPEALILKFEIDEQGYYSLPPNAVLGLHIGLFMYPATNTLRFDPIQLVAQIPNWEQLEEGTPMLLLRDMFGPISEDIQQQFVTDQSLRFSHSMYTDKRERVIGGWVCYQKTLYELNYLPGAIVNIQGGNTSLSVVADKKGEFSLYDGDGLYLEEGEEYQVEVIVDGVTVLSQRITKENSDYPNWPLAPEPNHFSEITGYVHDTAGAPLAGVTLTAGTHTTTTDEKGYYQLKHLVIGATYTLEASKEGYHFSPVELTVGEGQPVTIDLVEKNPTQCLLYAVHDTEQDKGRLKWVNPAEDLTRQNLPFSPGARQMSVAVANLDDDSDDEIVMAAQTGGYTITLAEFNGQTIRTFTTSMNGLLLATGDLDGDEQPEIVAASRSANRNSIQSYAPNGETLETIKLFENNTRMAPAVGDVDGDGKDDIIAGSLLKTDQVVIYHSATQERQTFSVFQATQTTRKKTEKQKPEPQKPTYGVQVATGDFDGDGKNEIVAAQASKGSRIEIYNADGALQNAFEAFESQKGVVITVGNVIGDEAPEILVGEAKGNLIRGFSVNGEQLFEFEAVEEGTVSSLAVFGCLEE